MPAFAERVGAARHSLALWCGFRSLRDFGALLAEEAVE